MACFVVSATAGVGVAVAKHVIKHHEKKLEIKGIKRENTKFGSDTKWSYKLAILELMLFSGSFLLAIEHILHGEVVPFPPFLTAASNPTDTIEMLHEMSTVGVMMMFALIIAWAIGIIVIDAIKYKKRNSNTLKERANN